MTPTEALEKARLSSARLLEMYAGRSEEATALLDDIDAALATIAEPRVQACRPEDRAMLATPAGAELLSRVADALAVEHALAAPPPQSPPGALTAEQERQRFEAWIQRELNYGYNLTPGQGQAYAHDPTDNMWLAWQARAALAARHTGDAE